MDERTGWCLGCHRTIDEIAAWTRLSSEDKRAVRAQLAHRRERAEAGTPAAAPAPSRMPPGKGSDELE
ncbi:DUF1289 domain-containing protein [Aquabacterium tepidiphilum]|uniref:DUF1289 domain-containing protein n=1 Tax=Caldimonas tepidiphila TaxID=2315841 RepID=UPI001F0C21C5